MTDSIQKLIAIYGRVSTAKQEEDGTIETQLSAVREFAKKNNYAIVQDYLDDGWSGDMLARPELDRLREDAKGKTRKWEAVLIYDPDRLARRYSYQELVIDELREAGVEVLFVTVSTPKNSEDKILHGVRGLFAEYERGKISERFRLGKLRTVKEGRILVSEALYGYRYIPKDETRHGYYEINEEEARVVRMIFRWVDEGGLTLRAVVRRLQKEGVKPRKSKRGVWNTSTLSHLLRNKAYIGEAHWGSSYAVVPENPLNTEKYKKNKKTSRKMKPESEWYTIPVPAIIERGVFERVRTRLVANFALCQRNKKNEYLLAGQIWCPCGRRRTGEGAMHGKHLYYRCSDRVYSYPLEGTCKEKGIQARDADRLIWEKITGLMQSPVLLMKELSRWGKERKGKAQAVISDVKALEKEIEKLAVQEDRYNKAYGAGVFTVEKLQEYVAPIREHKGVLEGQIRVERERSSQVEATSLPNEEQLRRFTELTRQKFTTADFALRRIVVLNTIDRIVGTKERLQVWGTVPVVTSENVELFTSDRNRRPPECRQIHTLQRAYQKKRAGRELSVLHHRPFGWRGGGAGRTTCEALRFQQLKKDRSGRG